MSDYIVRKANSNDLLRIKELHNQLLCVKYSNAFFELLITESQYQLYLIEDNRYIVGFASYKIEWEQTKNGYIKKACLLTFGVDESYQKKGIGSQLIETTGKMIVEKYKCSYIYLHCLENNAPVRSFYEHNHFDYKYTLKDYYTFDNQLNDACFYSREYNHICFSVFSYYFHSFIDFICC